MGFNKIQQENILIVEDDLLSAFVAEKILQKHFNTFTVKGGYEAIEVMEKQNFQAVLMDINLGDDNMDGLRAMRLIKNNPKHKRVKIFAITAFSDAREWYIKQGFEDMFMKPLPEEAVVKAIQDRLVIQTGESLLRRAC